MDLCVVSTLNKNVACWALHLALSLSQAFFPLSQANQIDPYTALA